MNDEIHLTPRKRWQQVALFVAAVAGLIEHYARPPRTDVVRAEFITLLIIYVALFLLAELLKPKPKLEDARPAGLGDFNFPTATESRVVPLIWGTVLLKGPNVIWYGDFRQKAITERIKTGLFSSERITKGYKYYVGIQFGLCRGQVDSLRSVYIGDTVVYSTPVTTDTAFNINLPNLFGGNDLGQGGVVGRVSFFRGSTTQAVSDYLAGTGTISATVAAGGSTYVVGTILTVVGGTGTPAKFQITGISSGAVTSVALISSGSYTTKPSNPVATTSSAGGSGCTLNLSYAGALQDAGAGTNRTPRYTGLCYCVLERGYIGNSTSIKPWSFEVRRIPNGLGLVTPSVNSGNDANPMNVIYEILTNTEWGFAFPAADIDTSNFTTAATTLATEGNGFSMVLDRTIEAAELLREVERQIDGVVFMDHRTGKYKVKLARADYDVNTVPELKKDVNILSIDNFTRGAWDDTANQVRIVFNDRAMVYTERTAFAQDTANALLQGGGSVTTGTNISVTANYPGVKDAALAAKLASRELRSLSYPLAKAKFVVNRSLWDVSPGDVVAFTDADLGLSKLPMRVVRIDYGDLANGKITLDCVQDVFQYRSAAFGSPPPTLWTPPDDTLTDFVNKSVFEAPRAFLTRNPDFAGSYGDRIWAGATEQGAAVGFKIYSRISPAAYAETGDVTSLLYRGTLVAALNRGNSTGVSFSVTMPSADDVTNLLTEFTAGATATDLGTNLVNLALIDSEFVLITGMAAGTGTNIDLTGVYRGVLDSVQADHSVSAAVFFLFAAGGLTDSDLTAGSTYDVKLLPYSRYDQLAEGSATATSVAMSNRLRKPYPPGRLSLNSVADDTTSVSLEGTGSGDTLGILLDIIRRDYRLADEVVGLTTDAATLFSDFPTLNTYVHQIEVRNDPAGANTLLYTIAYTNSNSMTLKRNDILKATDGVIPTTLGLAIRARHTYETVTRDATYDKTWAFTVATGLSGQFNFGALDQNETSNLYTATQNGTYNFTLNTALATGNVEYRLNGGVWLTLIATSLTTGSIVGVVATDTIEVRHTSSTAGTLTFLAMDAPSSGQDGYAILYKP